MQSIRRALIAVAALALMVGATHVLAQEPPPPIQEPPAFEEALPVEGELLEVDTDARTFAIETADGAQLQFRYTDETEVTGAEESIAGLATMTGVRVTVHYEGEPPASVATKIEVHADE